MKIEHWAALAAAALFATTGCATSSTPAPDAAAAETAELRRSLEQRNDELAAKQAEVAKLNDELRAQGETAELPPVSSRGLASGNDLLPPGAKPGECYARAHIPAQYTTSEERVLRREAATRVETLPAQYETVSERVLVKEASSRLVTVPATYETVRETVVVEPARTIWRLGNSRNSKYADDALLESARKLGLDSTNAAPGQCFAEYRVAPKFETRTEKVVSSEASSKVQIVPASYETVTERVLVKEAGTRIVEVPAVYETVTERIMVKPATTVWKKGSGPIQKIDDATGEIMCLVEVPAEYKTVSKRILKTAATTKTIEIPAEYNTVKVRKMTTAPSERRVDIPAKYSTVTKREQVADARRYWTRAGKGTEGSATGQKLCLSEIGAKTKTVTRRVEKSSAASKRVEIPAEYKTVKVRKLKTAASTRTIEIPAEYATVTKRQLVSGGQLEWRPVLCETNATRGVVSRIQSALTKAGHNAGPADGVIGRQTLNAIASYQEKNRLPKGGLNYETISALGVKVGR